MMATLKESLKTLWEKLKDRSAHCILEENELLRRDLEVSERKAMHYFSQCIDAQTESNKLKDRIITLEEKLKTVTATLRRVRKRKK